MIKVTISRLIKALKAQEAKVPKDIAPSETITQLKYWRMRILYSIFIGYAVFYFLRKNLSASMPAIMTDLNFSKTDLGLLWTLLYLSYGVSKFLNGALGDRSNPRYFMAIGLILSAVMNVFFGLSTTLLALGIFWFLNGWFQGMGWPPCARSLTQWFNQKERGTYWGIWNASHQVGGAIIMVLAGWLTIHFGWRSSFFIPAAIAVICAIFLINRLRDSPESLGLPSIVESNLNSPHNLKTSGLFRQVLKNPYLWALAFGNFFVYIVRFGIMDWSITFLVQTKGAHVAQAALQVAGFELTGILGSFLAGFFSDRFFRGRRGPINVIYMLLLIFGVFIFWFNPPGNPIIDATALGIMGFLIYGPQMLVGVAAADIAGKKFAATATGFTGFTGYLGSMVSGVGIGWTVDQFGWNGGILLIVLCAFFGALCFVVSCIGDYKKV